MGDPTGIGAEVTLSALARPSVQRELTPILVGDLEVFRTASQQLSLGARFAAWSPPAPLPRGALPVRVVARLGDRQRRPGRPTPAGGQAAYAAIVEAVRLVLNGHAHALVTAPICKANLVAAGKNIPGHTELLAALTKAAPVRMMMVGSRLRVVLVTTHMGIARVPTALSRRLVFDTIAVTHRTLRAQFGIARPRIGVAGLNPHAGEQGVFGDEERRIIAPAVADAVHHRIDAEGPLAADSLFPFAAAGKFDAVVCMYHDQGLAPFKLLHFADGVNFTAGLPFVRTSPDHGTAHDIAGLGRADATSMVAALRLAAQLSENHPSGRPPKATRQGRASRTPRNGSRLTGSRDRGPT